MTDAMSRRYQKTTAAVTKTPEQKAEEQRQKAIEEDAKRKKAFMEEDGDTQVAQAVPMA